MENNGNMSEHELGEKLANQEMTFVEYINQHDQNFIDEYNEYCEENGFDANAEESAYAFIEYREDLMEEFMEY